MTPTVVPTVPMIKPPAVSLIRILPVAVVAASVVTLISSLSALPMPVDATSCKLMPLMIGEDALASEMPPLAVNEIVDPKLDPAKSMPLSSVIVTLLKVPKVKVPKLVVSPPLSPSVIAALPALKVALPVTASVVPLLSVIAPPAVTDDLPAAPAAAFGRECRSATSSFDGCPTTSSSFFRSS